MADQNIHPERKFHPSQVLEIKQCPSCLKVWCDQVRYPYNPAPESCCGSPPEPGYAYDGSDFLVSSPEQAIEHLERAIVRCRQNIGELRADMGA